MTILAFSLVDTRNGMDLATMLVGHGSTEKRGFATTSARVCHRPTSPPTSTCMQQTADSPDKGPSLFFRPAVPLALELLSSQAVRLSGVLVRRVCLSSQSFPFLQEPLRWYGHTFFRGDSPRGGLLPRPESTLLLGLWDRLAPLPFRSRSCVYAHASPFEQAPFANHVRHTPFG